ncbi:5-hydroxytryptamine receptor 3A-like [Brachionichthys hirsutus]|uniref:5-hydroxytryptamine receptor 3A-like n=1 Tax=Brachionichthys hirsutus TaxID=412623 RepID=UPI003605406C
MAVLRVLLVLAFAGEASSVQQPACSYLSLLRHLKLDTANHLVSITRPVRNWTTPTWVWVDMLLHGILKVDEKAQTVSSHVWRHMSWSSEFLTWNSTEFCGIEYLTVPTSSIWIPDVSILEDVSDTGSIYTSPVVKLHHSGFASTTARQRLTTACRLGLRLFPFDRQQCNITFLSTSSEASSIHMGALNNGSVLTHVAERFMSTQGEWDLRKMDIAVDYLRSGESFSSKVVYMVFLARKPMLYVINLIVPLLALLVLDLASFFIHEARGEKLSFKVTVLLSISVLLLVLQDMLPSTEDRLPMIASYCVAVFGLVGVSVLEAILVGYLIDLDAYFGRTAQTSAQRDKQPEDAHLGEPAAAEEKLQVKPEQSDLPLDGLQQILQAVAVLREEAERRVKERGDGTYRRMAEIIDAVFFVLYFVAVAVFLSYMYAAWVSHAML